MLVKEPARKATVTRPSAVFTAAVLGAVAIAVLLAALGVRWICRSKMTPKVEPVVVEIEPAKISAVETPKLAPPVPIPRQIEPILHLPVLVPPPAAPALTIPTTTTIQPAIHLAKEALPNAAAAPIRVPPAEPERAEPQYTDLKWIIQAGCSSCGGGGGTISGQPLPDPISFAKSVGCSECGTGGCVPGKKPCYPCDCDSHIGRFLCGVYECICCPDPCYEGRWTPVADASFFTDAPRPITQQRFRWDAGLNVMFPDRSEYFWGAPPLGPTIALSNPTTAFKAEKNLSYNDLSVYTEVATGLISFFVDVPYRSIDGDITGHAAGFGDINLGTKTLLYDCELFQIAFQFKTYILSGVPVKGLGTGHMSIEPSVLLGLRISPDTYLETQVGEWIPFGNPFYSGAILKANASLNQVLWRIMPNVPLIATAEIQTLNFQDGAYTDPVLGAWQKSSGYTYINVGPGLRLFICDRIDFGIGTSFALTEKHFAEQLYTSEFRVRY
jgi:hypothetical protein